LNSFNSSFGIVRETFQLCRYITTHHLKAQVARCSITGEKSVVKTLSQAISQLELQKKLL